MHKFSSLFIGAFLSSITVLHAEAPLWNSNLYHKHHAPQLATANKLLEDVLIPKDATILDVGCGTGDITAYLASLAPFGTTLGVDASEDMIYFAQNTYFSNPNLFFKQLDARNLSLKGYQFDYVFSLNCLHWIDDIPTVIRGIAHILKPGGYFIATLAHKNHFLYEHVKNIAQLPEWAHYFKDAAQEPWYAHTSESFTVVLIEAGITPLAVTTWYKQNNFKNKQAFKKFIEGWIPAIPHMQQLPAELQDSFMNSLVEQFLNTCTFQEDGSFSFIAPVLLVKAQK